MLISVWLPDLETVCTYFSLCVVSTFLLLFGVLFFFDCLSCCILDLSCSTCSSFEVTVGLVFELLLDGVFLVFVVVFLEFVLLTSPELSAVHLPH